MATMLDGTPLPSNMAAKTSFCLDLVKRLIVALTCAVNVPTSTFQPSPWSLRAKFVFRKSLFTISKITLIFGHVTNYELTHFKKTVQVWKTKSLLFCSRHDPLLVFWRKKSNNFHFHKNDVTWPLSASGLLLVSNKINALCQTHKHYIYCYKQQKWTLKTVRLTSFQKGPYYCDPFQSSSSLLIHAFFLSFFVFVFHSILW